MLDWNRWLPGLGHDAPEEDDPVTKTLKALGQGVSDVGAGISQGIADAGTAIGSGLSSAAQSVSDAYAVPTEQRPPAYSGPSYAQPALQPGEQSTAERLPAMAQAGVEGAGAMLGDRGAMLAGLKPPQTAMEVIEQAAPAPVRGLQIGREALRAAGGAALEAAPQTTEPLFTTNEIQTPLGTIPSMTGPTPQQAGRFVGEELADPTNYLSFGAAGRAADAPVGAALSAAGRGLRAAPGAVRRGVGDAAGAVGEALAGNAERMAVADARMAQEGSTAAPGVFGLSGIEPGRPEVQGMRPRIIPPDVADQLDIPLRLPEDPAVVRAIEAAGGTVDERGTTLNVIRHQDPEAAGGAATRSMTFYTAGPPGAPSEYARTGTVGPQGVGGQQRIEGRTRFRNPLFISDAPGEARGFDDAMRQMVEPRLQAAQHVFDQATADWEAAMRSGAPNLKEVVDDAFARRQQAYDRLAEARATTPPVATAEAAEQGIRAAKRAGPAGSAARAEALKTLVTRYGGDADVIDDLIALRGAELGESVYAVKENIVAGNARRAGHDGVITIKGDHQGALDALEAEIAAHPRYQAAQAAFERAEALYDQTLTEHAVAMRESGYAGNKATNALRLRLEDLYSAKDDAKIAAEKIHDALVDQIPLKPRGKITELADPREARNPTPGAPNPAIADAKERLREAMTAKTSALRARRDAVELGDIEAERLALNEISRQQDAQAQATMELTAAMKSPTVTPPGYTLRPDIPARAGTPEASRRAAEAAEEAAHQARLDTAFNHPDVQAAGQRALAADAALKQARASGDAAAIAAAAASRDAAYAEHARLQREAFQAGGGANASAGALPAARGSDPFAIATRAISEPLAGSVGGATIGAGLPAETDEERRQNALRGAGIGAVGFPAATRLARGAARLAGAAPSPGGGVLGTLGSLPEALPPSTLGPVAQRVMDTYTALTPKRAEAVTARGIDVATAAIAKRARPGAMPVPAAELVPQIHAAVVRNLDDTKVVMTGLNYGALRAFLRGEGLTSKAETGSLDLINQITTTQVNVAGGRQVLNAATGKMEKAPFTITEGADFAQRESEQMKAVTGGTRFPDPETGAIDTEAPKVLYAYVSEGQPLVAPNRPTLGLVWKPETPRVSSVNHPFGLLSPNLDMHKAMAEGSQELVYAADAVRGGRIAPATMEGGRLVEAAPGVPSSGKARFGWEQGGIDIGGGRKLVDTDYLVGPEGESSLRATSLVSGMSKDIQEAIARGQMTDPEQIAAVLMRGGSPQWKPGWGSVMNPTRTESLVLDPHLANVQAIYISGTPKNLASMLEGAGKGKGAGERLAELEMARRMRAAIKEQTGNDVPIIFNDTTRTAASAKQLKEGASNAGWAPRLISDAQVLEGPPLTLSPGRGRIVDQYTQATDPTTGAPYMNIGVTAGATPRLPGTGVLPAVNRALSEGLAGGIGGAVIEQGRNPDEDPRTAAARGFAAGAVGFPLATRGARGLARLAGARGAEEAGGALGILGAVPGGGKLEARWQQATQKAAAQAAAAQAAGKAPPATASDWLRSIGYSAMIGPSTGIVNAVGNGMELAYHLPKDLGRAIVRGRPGEAAVEGRAILTGFMRSGGEMLDALAGAHPGGGVETARLSQRTTNRLGRVAAGLLEAPTRVFSELPDAFYRTIAESMGEARGAAQVASDAGLSGAQWKQHVTDLLEDAKQVRAGQRPQHADTQRVLDEAQQLAERLTLRGDIGPRGTAFKQGIDALPFGLGHLVMPFFNTPYQMTQRLLERTPAGLAMGTQPARYDKIYDALVGSTVAAGAAGLATGGLISGSGPQDPNQRKLLQSQGWQNNSTLVNGVWVPNNAFGVFGPMLDAAGELGDAMRYQKKDATGRDLGGDLARRAGEVAKNQVYLKGVADLLKALENPAQFGENYAASSLSRLIPGGATARTIATAEDPLERRPEPGKEVGFVENVRQRVARGLPELAAPLPGISSRQELPADQDVLGRPVENPRAGAGALGPRTRTPQSDPVLERFEQAGVTIGPPRDALTEDGQTVDLTPAETRRWNEIRGDQILGRTQRLIENGVLDRLPPERRAERLEEIKTEAADRATEGVRREIGPAEYRRRRKAAA